MSAAAVEDLFGVTHGPRRRAMGSHQSAVGGTDEWLTPPELIKALGPFDLDPCSPGDRRPWDTAAKHYSIEDDGLAQPWEGRVWCNPPYAQTAKWLPRLAEHGSGLALIFARTETRPWFEHVWPKATGILFLRGRLTFYGIDGKRAKANAGAPSVLIAYSDEDAEVLAAEPIPGHYVHLRSARARHSDPAPATLHPITPSREDDPS